MADVVIVFTLTVIALVIVTALGINPPSQKEDRHADR